MEEDDDFISKTRRKQQMHDLQAIGKELVKLTPDKLARLELPENLLEAVLDARSYTKHEAIRRQLQYIGKIMRDIDAAPIVEKLNALEAPSRKQTAVFHVAEKWRTTLIDDPGAVAAFVQEYPEADPNVLHTLALGAVEEKRQGKPPRRFRELFHALNTILQEHARKPS